jgi:hypothetical protein
MLVFASILLGALAAPTVLAMESEASGEVVRWEDFDDPDFDPIRHRPRSAQRAGGAAMSLRASSIKLGPMGVDVNGVEGRVHTVVRRETLWDISEAYLGTPWVWPSVWNENDEIENPHVIEPGDHIWITSTEMRPVSAEEAEQLLTSVSDAADEPVADEPEYLPEMFPEPELAAAPAEEMALEPELPAEAVFAPVMTGEMLTLPPGQPGLIVSSDVLDSAGEIVDSSSQRVYLTQKDEVYLALGEGEVEVGDQFTIFRHVRQIRDPKNRRLIGHHIDELGWLVIREVKGESSIAVIDEAVEDIKRGDRLIPRIRLPQEVAIREPQEGMTGLIALMPGYRRMMGTTDSVYVNLGSIHGIELGSQLEVYRQGTGLARPTRAKMPDAVVAHLVAINVQPEVSAAVITQTNRELEVGDQVRSVTQARLVGR